MVAYHYPPDGSTTGVLRTLKFSKYLPQHGWMPHILTLKEWAYASKDYELLQDIPKEVVVHRAFGLDNARHLSIQGRHLALLSIPDPFLSWLPFGIARGLSTIRKGGFRALYSTSPPPTAHLIAASLKAVTGLPWVADFRDPWIEEGFHPRPGSLRYRIESALEKRVVMQADRLIVTTPHLKKDFLCRYPELSPENVIAIYNGYDESDFNGLDGPLRSDRFEIIHAGLITPEFRDPFPLLETVASMIAERTLPLEETRVTFLGDGGYTHSEGFTNRVKQMGLDQVVQIADRVPHREALRRLQQAAVLLLLQASNDTKSLIPAKAFEYLRLGRPILALTLEGATADLLTEMDGCYVIDPGDRAGLQRHVSALYKRWQGSHDHPYTSRQIFRYERSNLTAELARLLEELEPKRDASEKLAQKEIDLT